MGENGGFNGEIDLPGGSFSRLMSSANDVDRSFFGYFSATTPKMLRFGDFAPETTQKSALTSSGKNNLNSSKSQRKRKGSGQESGHGSANGKKKNKPEKGPTTSVSGPTTVSVPHAKGRREKLGERITALQQLVAPYGKTDTASVLHEAMGYIRFLQNQVKVLYFPYLHQLSPTEKEEAKGWESEKNLKSRGLCLVPVDCIIEVAKANPNGNGGHKRSSSVANLAH